MRHALVLLLVAGCSRSGHQESKAATLQVPGDTALLVNVSLAKLRTSVVWPRIESAIAAQLPIEDVKTKCSFDPVQGIESISLAAPAELHPERVIVLARGIERSVADACAKTLSAAKNHPITVSDENKLVAYRESDGAMFAAWLDAKTVAVVPGDLGAPERLRLLVDKPAAPSAAFTEQANKLATGHTLAFAFAAPPETDVRAFVAQTGAPAEAGHGWLDLDSALRGELTLRFGSAQQASTVAGDITKRIADDPSLGSMLRGVKATAAGNDVVLTLALDKAQTEQLLALVASAAPAQ